MPIFRWVPYLACTLHFIRMNWDMTITLLPPSNNHHRNMTPFGIVCNIRVLFLFQKPWTSLFNSIDAKFSFTNVSCNTWLTEKEKCYSYINEIWFYVNFGCNVILDIFGTRLADYYFAICCPTYQLSLLFGVLILRPICSPLCWMSQLQLDLKIDKKIYSIHYGYVMCFI